MPHQEHTCAPWQSMLHELLHCYVLMTRLLLTCTGHNLVKLGMILQVNSSIAAHKDGFLTGQQSTETASRPLPIELQQPALKSNPSHVYTATALGLPAALSSSRSQGAVFSASATCSALPSGAPVCVTDQMQSHSLSICTEMSAAVSKIAHQQLGAADIMHMPQVMADAHPQHAEPAEQASPVQPSENVARLTDTGLCTQLDQGDSPPTGCAAAEQLRLSVRNQPSLEANQPNSSQQQQIRALPLHHNKRSSRSKVSRRRRSSKHKPTGALPPLSTLPPHWQTLGDVLQEVSLNGITLKGYPLWKGTQVCAVPPPPTPVYSPSQAVGTRPLAHMLSGKDHVPAPGQPSRSPHATFLAPPDQRFQLPHAPKQTPRQLQPHLHHQLQMPSESTGHLSGYLDQHSQLFSNQAGSVAQAPPMSAEHDQAACLHPSRPAICPDAAIATAPPALTEQHSAPGLSHYLQNSNYTGFALCSSSSAQIQTPVQAVQLALSKLFSSPSCRTPTSDQAHVSRVGYSTEQSDIRNIAPDCPSGVWLSAPPGRQDKQQTQLAPDMHQTPQLQLDRTCSQLEASSQAPPAWQQPSRPGTPPLFHTPAEAPIMQGGHDTFNTPHQTLVTSPCAPASTPQQLPPTDTQQNLGIVSGPDATAAPCQSPDFLWSSPASSTASLPCQAQGVLTTVQHAFQRKATLPHALIMIPVASHAAQPPPQSGQAVAVKQTKMPQAELPELSVTDHSTRDVGRLEGSHHLSPILPSPVGCTAANVVGATHDPLAAPGYRSDRQPGLLYGLPAIAVSARHLLESFDLTADTASIEVDSTQQRVNFLDLLSCTATPHPNQAVLLASAYSCALRLSVDPMWFSVHDKEAGCMLLTQIFASIADVCTSNFEHSSCCQGRSSCHAAGIISTVV